MHSFNSWRSGFHIFVWAQVWELRTGVRLGLGCEIWWLFPLAGNVWDYLEPTPTNLETTWGQLEVDKAQLELRGGVEPGVKKEFAFLTLD